MKKVFSVLVVFALFAALFAGVVAQDKVTLTVWESVGGPDEWLIQAGEKYAEMNPNVTVEFVNVEIVDSSTQIALDGPSGIGPDLFAAPHDKLGELVAGGHVLPTVDAEVVAAAILPSAAQALTYDGVMYGYPTTADTYVLFYNKELVDKAPETFEELADWVREFNEANPDKYGFVMDVGNAYYTILFTTMNGNRLFGPDGLDTSSSYLATEDAIAGMKIFQSLHDVVPFNAADLDTGTADGAFSAGTAALHISGPWNVSKFTEDGIDFGVATLPSLDGKVPASSFSGTRGMFVSAYSAHPEEAADFAKFLISEEMQRLRYEITGAIPAIPLEVESEIVNGFIEQLKYAFPMPSVPAMTAFWDSAGAASANIWDGADVEAELQKLDTAIVGFTAK